MNLNTLKTLYGIKAKIKDKTGRPDIAGRIYFEVISPKKINNDVLRQIQSSLGYPPMGYGFFKPTRYFNIENGMFRYTFECSRSCD